MKRRARRAAFAAILSAVLLIALGLAFSSQGVDCLVPFALCLCFFPLCLSLPALPSLFSRAEERIRAEARSPPSFA